MKNYEELARLRANEAIKNGLESQRYQRLTRKDNRRTSGSFVVFILAIALVLASIAVLQVWVIP